MPSASADGVTIINFGMGSANAATVMDLLSAVKPEAVLFLGKCGGIKGKQIGRLYFTDSGHSWGRNIERLFSTRSPGIAGFHVATGSFHSRQESPSRLLTERFTRLTVGYGSLTIISKTIYVAYVVWPSIWKQPHCFQLIRKSDSGRSIVVSFRPADDFNGS